MNKPTIICIDDETMVLTALKSQLKRHLGTKYALELVSSAEEALEVVNELLEEETDIPVVISDQIMPGMKGDELLIELNKISPKTKKIMLTGQAGAAAVGNAVNKANLYRFIEKPWGADDLQLTVKEAITSFYQQQKLETTENDKQSLVQELEITNDHLEEMIKRRTSEVETKNLILEHKNREITSSIQYAKFIQKSVLPPEEKIGAYFTDLFLLFLPKDIVSGDFYWAHQDQHNEDIVYLLVADCTGHGVPGAFMSLLGVTLFNEVLSYSQNATTGEVFDKVKEKVIHSLHQHDERKQRYDGMDGGIIRYNRMSRQLSYSGAYNSLIILRASKEPLKSVNGDTFKTQMTSDSGTNLYSIEGDRQPLAFHPKEPFPFKTTDLQLNEGDEVFLYTDGYADQFGGTRDKKYLAGRLKRYLMELYGKECDAQKWQLYGTFLNWKGKNDQTDDICFAGLKI